MDSGDGNEWRGVDGVEHGVDPLEELPDPGQALLLRKRVSSAIEFAEVGSRGKAFLASARNDAGGGFELALACDIIVADKMARFAFPELRLGLIPGFGGIPRLKRDLGNAFVRDLLLTGRSINASRAHAIGLVAQLAAEGETVKIARSTAAQITKFDGVTRAAAKKFIKVIPDAELRQEIDLFCELFTRPAVMAALKKFVESTDAMPYLP